MKILLASDCYTYQINGVSRVVRSLSRGLRAMGHDVRVLAPANSFKSFRNGTDYYIKSVPALYYKGERFSLNLWDPLIRELTEWEPDIIHLHSEGGVALLTDGIRKKTGTPLVETIHTNYPYYIFGEKWDTPPARVIAGAVGRFLYKRADCIIAPSEKVRSFPYIEPIESRTTVIPNGIDPEYWKQPVSGEEKASLFNSLRLVDNGHTMITVSRLGKEKHIQEILKALPRIAAKMPDIQFVIVGDGPFKRKLEALCKSLCISKHVHFTGMISPERVRSFLSMGDVFVSASNCEVHSIAYLEAMASGLPLAVKEDLSIRGVVEKGKHGFVFRDGDELVSSVLRILLDGGLRERMRENAFLAAETFSEKKCVERTESLYTEVLSQMMKVGHYEERHD